jgi:hypothetical protein
MLKRTFGGSLFLVSTCVSLLGCGGADEAPAEELTASASESVSVDPTVYWWSQNLSAPRAMTPVDTSVCFITQIEGQYLGSGEGVYIENIGGVWHLNGRSQQSGVLAVARCVTNVDLDTDTTKEFKWVQGTHSNGQRVELKDRSGNAISTSSWSCFLTRMEGEFLGYGEEIRVYVPSGDDRWVIEGKSQQADVVGGARCIRKTRRAGDSWYNGDSSVTLPFNPSDNDVCFLTRVSGNFSAGALVSVYTNNDLWNIFGTAHFPDRELMASARCLE